MSAVHNTKSTTTPTPCTGGQFCSARLCVHAQPRGGAVVISVTGELDASNVDNLAGCAKACYTSGHSFVLDFSELKFFGAQGIRSLFEIADECDGNGSQWAFIPSREVTRLLRICDKDDRLPTAESFDAALEKLSARSRARRLLQLVTKSG